jgi:hypothetical protein
MSEMRILRAANFRSPRPWIKTPLRLLIVSCRVGFLCCMAVTYGKRSSARELALT